MRDIVYLKLNRFYFFFTFAQVEFYMMCHAKCAVIIVRVNIMESLRVTDVLVSSNVRYDVPVIMYAKQKQRANVLSIRRIEISAVHVD